MKKAFLSIALLLGLVLVFSCNKDKDDDNNASIIGKWTFTGGNVHTIAGDSALAGNASTTWEFKSDGTSVSIDSTGETSTSSYTYNSSTKVFTETEGDSTLTYNVTKLTTSDLQVHNTGTVIVFNVPVAYDATLNFKR